MSASKLAVVSDIHGNAVALDAVLADIARRRVDSLVCLGDVAAGGPQPRETIKRLRALGSPVVRGNADEWLIDGLPDDDSDPALSLRPTVEWARQQLSPGEFAFLSALPSSVVLELRAGVRVFCFHGSPCSNRERIMPTSSDAEIDALLQDFSALVYVGGHTHLQMLRRYGGGLLVNAGSVGLPVGSLEPMTPSATALPRWAEYAIVGADEGTVAVELCRVGVDITVLERVAERSGMPHAGRWAVDLERRVKAGNTAAASPARSTPPRPEPQPSSSE